MPQRWHEYIRLLREIRRLPRRCRLPDSLNPASLNSRPQRPSSLSAREKPAAQASREIERTSFAEQNAAKSISFAPMMRIRSYRAAQIRPFKESLMTTLLKTMAFTVSIAVLLSLPAKNAYAATPRECMEQYRECLATSPDPDNCADLYWLCRYGFYPAKSSHAAMMDNRRE
jgi:hypothetical protein